MGVHSCCCFSLKTGTTIIASLYILFAIFRIIESFQTQEPPYKSQNGTIAPLGILIIVENFINLAFTVMFLIGTLKEKANFILTYLGWFVIDRLFSTVFICVFPPQGIRIAVAQYGLAPLLLGCLIGLGIVIYLGVVIYSFYRKLRISEQAGYEVGRV